MDYTTDRAAYPVLDVQGLFYDSYKNGKYPSQNDDIPFGKATQRSNKSTGDTGNKSLDNSSHTDTSARVPFNETIDETIAKRKRTVSNNNAIIEIYANDVVIKRKRTDGQSKPVKRDVTPRKPITRLSDKSRKNLLFHARNLTGIVCLITLTYPYDFPTDGREVKEHWNKMRKWLVAEGIGGLWVIEFQQRGAAHIHILATGKPDISALASKWYVIVASNDKKHLKAGTQVKDIYDMKGVAFYMSKYSEQKQIPADFAHIGRMWGSFGNGKIVPIVLLAAVSVLAPVIRVIRQIENARRKQKGYFAKKDNGRYSRTVKNVSTALQNVMTRLLPSDVLIRARATENRAI